MGNPHYFRQPGKRDDKREAESFNPEDRIRFSLNLFHKFLLCLRRHFLSRKSRAGFGWEPNAPGSSTGPGRFLNRHKPGTETSLVKGENRLKLAMVARVLAAGVGYKSCL